MGEGIVKTIWKWTLQVAAWQAIPMPRGAQILSVQTQGDLPQIWALCNSDEPKEQREIAIIGTGHEISEGPGRYISTFQMLGGSLVFHAFELKRA